MSRQSVSPHRRVLQTTSKTLAEYSYTLEVTAPIRGTNIYETLCPHGSHVFVDVDPIPAREKSHPKSQALDDLIGLAEQCCEHMTGYVIIHPETTVVKHVSGEVYYLPGQGRTNIRIAPLLTLEEITADPINSGLNADRVTVSILEKMLVHVYSTQEEYDSAHKRNAEIARKYFHSQTEMLDSAVEKAQLYRSKMLTSPGDANHGKSLAVAIETLERLHTHSTLIKSHLNNLDSLYATLEAIHSDM